MTKHASASTYGHRIFTRSGVLVAPVLLHTGVSSQDAGESPQPERFEMTADTAAQVNAARSRGGRVVAVGTTATRAIESAAGVDGLVEAASGWTELVIGPDRPVRVVILSIGLIFAKGAGFLGLNLLAPAVYVLAGLSSITVWQRIWHVRGALRETPEL